MLRAGLGIFQRLSVGTCRPFSEQVQAREGTGGSQNVKGYKIFLTSQTRCVCVCVYCMCTCVWDGMTHLYRQRRVDICSMMYCSSKGWLIISATIKTLVLSEEN